MPESAAIHGGARILGDWMVPGTPSVRLNGRPQFGGVVDAAGRAEPANYTVGLNGGAMVGRLVRRVDPSDLDTVPPPEPVKGTRSARVNASTQSVGPWATIRDVTLNSGAGALAMPPGSYGTMVLGSSAALNGTLATADHPEWLHLAIGADGLTLNGGSHVNGYVRAPSGHVALDGRFHLVGGLACDRLTVNGGASLRLVELRPTADDRAVHVEEDSSLAIALGWFWRPAGTTEEVNASDAPTGHSARSEESFGGTTSGQPPESEGTGDSSEKELEFLRGMGRLSNRPIEFYGLVLDQDGNPLPDVEVKLSIRSTKEPVPGAVGDGFDYPIVRTDDRGRFEMVDAKGALLSVQELSKPGYEASKRGINRAYWYWRSPEMTFTPDRESPEVFRMWRIAGAERLVRKGISAALRFDGTPLFIDLLSGRLGDAGDIRVSLVRDPRQITFGQRNFGWTLTIEAPNGGVSESTDEQMYLAPAEGYQSELVFSVHPDSASWTDEKLIRFYAKVRDGRRYARLEMKVLVGSDRETAPLYITSYLNPSGSRNLEYDSLQNVVPSERPEAGREEQ